MFESELSTEMLRKYPVRAKEDPLNYLLVHHYLLVNHKIISPINYFSCTIALILTTIASLNFISNEGLGNFVKNNAFGIAGTFFVLVNIAVEYLVMRKLHDHVKLELYWDIETASLSKRHEIVKEIREEYRIYLAITIVTIFAAFLNFMLENFTDIHILCDTILVEKMLTGYQTTKIIIKFVLSLTHFCGILSVISQTLGMKYGAGTLKIQLSLLVDYLNQIEIYHSEEQKIKAHLEICSIHHIFLTGYRHKILELGAYSILFLPFCAMVVAVGFVLYIYYNNDLVSSLYMLVFSILLLLLIIDTCKSGQDVQNAFEDFYWEMTKVAWWNWSERNKKALLLMMTRCQKDEAFGALTIEINKSLLIKIAKMVYQALLVIQQTLN